MLSRGLPLHSWVKADKPEVILEAKPWPSGFKWLGKTTTSVAVPTVTLRRQGRRIASWASLSRSRWTPSIVGGWGLLTGAAVILGTLPFQRGNNLDLSFDYRKISKFSSGAGALQRSYELAIFPILQGRKTALSRVTLLCLGLWIHSPCFSHLPTGSQSGYSGTGGHPTKGEEQPYVDALCLFVWRGLRDRITCSPDWPPTSTGE